MSINQRNLKGESSALTRAQDQIVVAESVVAQLEKWILGFQIQ